MKKKVLVSLLVIAVVAGLVGAGTWAQWSDTGTSSANTFTAGTLVLQLSNDYVNWADGVTGTWVSPAGWAPGQSFTSTIYLRNTGSVNALAVYTDWDAFSLADTSGLSNWIEVTRISDSTDNYAFNAIPAPAPPDVPVVDANRDGKVSLNELATWSERNTSADPGEIETTGIGSNPALAANGGTLGVRFTFKLMEDTPNAYQGTSCTINVVLTASQTIL